jgi:hypothetical protein
MFRQTLAAGLMVLTLPASLAADELKTATKGKADAVQTYYGDLQSFDGTTLAFAVPMSRPAASGPEAARQMLVPPETMTMTFKPLEVEVEIRLNVSDPQASINGTEFAQSTPDRYTRDVDLQRQQYQAAQAAHDKAQQNNQAEQRDLRRCSTPGGDQIIERDHTHEGKELLPVTGKILSIKNGYAILKRVSDSQQQRYSLEDLSRIVLGSCSVPAH